MSTSQRNDDPELTEGAKRPYVTEYSQKPRFHPGDKVYLLRSDGTREGPYLVASVPRAGKYTLSLETGEDVDNGQEFGVDALEAV